MRGDVSADDSTRSTDIARTLSPGESDAWAWGLLDSVPDAVVIADGERRVRGWNRRAVQLYGYDPTGTVGRDLLDIPPFEGPTGLGSLVEDRLRRGSEFSTAEFVRSVDGRGVAVRSLPPLDARAVDPRSVAGGGMIVIVREDPAEDGSGEAGELKARLERGRALFDTMLRQLVIGLVVVEAPSGRVLLHNDEAAHFMTRTTVRGLQEAVSNADGAEHADERPYRVAELPLARAMTGETVRHEEMVYRGREGKPLVFSVNAAPVRDEGGTIRYAVATIDDISERRAREAALRANEEELERMNQRLLYDALHDVLTGLPNRTLLLDRLEQVLHRRLRDPDRDAALLFLDFDRFKVVNDSLGHAAGDAMLVAVSRILADVVRPEDTVARLGGDEFVILVDHVDSLDRPVRLAERIAAALEEPVFVEGQLIYTSASVGIVPSMIGYQGAHDVLRDADTAMYGAKARGRGNYQVFDRGMRSEALATMELETDLRRAVAAGQLGVLYGPIHRLDTGEVVGFEALVRWRHPTRGILLPERFLRAATDMGLGRQIDHRVWNEASRTLATLRTRFAKRLLLSLNFSGQHFLAARPEEQLVETLRKTGGDVDQTVVELAEDALRDASDEAAASLLKLVAHGVRVHLDDFGTGTSSLADVQRFHVGALKVDARLVQGMVDDPKCAELVRTIVGLAENLDVEVIAKGVETEEQRRHLAALGCTYAQGFLYSAPVDEEGAVRLLEAQADRFGGPEIPGG